MAALSPDAGEFLELMPSLFIIEPFVARDTYGKATYGPAPPPYSGHKSDKQQFIRASTGEQIVARGMIWISTAAKITVNDRVTCPDGSQPKILDVDTGEDETGGVLYTRLALG